VWFYFEREDHLDVVRLRGERQDILAIFESVCPAQEQSDQHPRPNCGH